MKAKVRGVDLWRTSFQLLKGSLIGALQLLAAWTSEASSLIQDWKVGVDTGGHAWDGGAFQDEYLIAFKERMEEVSS